MYMFSHSSVQSFGACLYLSRALSGSRMIHSDSTFSWSTNTCFCMKLNSKITTSQRTRDCCWTYWRYLRSPLLCSYTSVSSHSPSSSSSLHALCVGFDMTVPLAVRARVVRVHRVFTMVLSSFKHQCCSESPQLPFTALVCMGTTSSLASPAPLL